MSNDNQSWVWVIGAVAVLLVAGIGVKQCGSSSSEQALQVEAERAVALAARGDRGGWSTSDSGDAAGALPGGRDGAGVGLDGAASDRFGARGSGTSGGSAQSVRDQLRHQSQRAAGAAGGSNLRVDGVAPGMGTAGGSDPFREARERMASNRGNTMAQAAPGGAPLVLDENGNDPTETPALSVLAKEGEARDDTTLVDYNTASYKAGEGHVFDTESQVTIPNAGNITGDAGSIAFELKPKWEGHDHTDASLLDLRTPNKWENRMEVVKNGPYLRFLMWDSEGNENGIGYEMKNWQPDVPHPVAVTWGTDENGQKLMSLYVDGALVGRRTYENDFNVPNDQPLVIGNNAKGDLGARSVLNGFQVYNKLIPADRVGGLSFGRAP